jgi:hypothetical protein
MSPAPAAMIRLVEHFSIHVDAYRAGRYNETQVRREFVSRPAAFCLRFLLSAMILVGALGVSSPTSRAMDGLSWPGVFRRSGEYILFGGCGAGWDLWKGNAQDRNGKAIQVPGDDQVYIVGNIKVQELAETEEDQKQVNYVAIEPIETDYGVIAWALVGDHPIWPANEEETTKCRRQEKALNSTATPLPTVTATPTPMPTATPSPADVRITAYTLSDQPQVSDFSVMQQPVILRANRLWVEVTNVGGLPFAAPSGGAGYTLQVILNKAGEKLQEYTYAPGQPSTLEPLPGLQPGASYVLRVDDLFFWAPVDDAQLYVLLKPEPDLNLRDSLVTRSASVQQNPDSACACVAAVAHAVLETMAARYGASAIDAAGLGAALEQDGCPYPEKMVGDVARWLVEQAANLAGGQLGAEELGQVSSLALEVASEAQSQALACLSIVEWTSAVAHALLGQGFPVNTVVGTSRAAEWPGYPLVVNTAGQRAGLLEDGQVAQEIPGSRAVLLGDTCVILYPAGAPVEVQFAGHAAGAITLNTILAQDDGSAMSLSYRYVSVEAGTKASLDSEDREYKLEIDLHGDGQALESRLPDQVRKMTKEGTILAQPSRTPTATVVAIVAAKARPPATATPTPAPRTLGASMARNWPVYVGALLVVVALVAGTYVFRARRAKEPASPPGDKPPASEPPADRPDGEDRPVA